MKNIFHEYNAYETAKRTDVDKLELCIEMLVGVFLIIALALHLAAVGIIGLAVIILLTSFKGITHEHDLGDAFKEALPFTALLVVFFGVVSVIADQGLFSPIIGFVLVQETNVQAPIFFVANGLLSAISDNVFVATIYINEIKEALDQNIISRSQFDLLAIAINTGTNIPSIATPNGQAAFLFLLTSSLAPLINLSYMRMVIMALPYTIVLSIVGFISVVNFL
jgi:NhaB family Na+:H+ antiporter